jgi:hypothetical protein
MGRNLGAASVSAHLLEHHLHLVTDSELVRVAIDDVRLQSRTGSLRAISSSIVPAAYGTASAKSGRSGCRTTVKV